MTKEQIEQNAEEYANEYMVRTDGGGWEEEYDYEEQKAAYITGAHSRDEEIKELKEEIESLKENEKELFEGFKKRGTKLGELMKENVKLRNPWISIKDHLPEMFVDSKGITHDFSVKVLVTNENNPNYWHVAEYYPDKNEWCCLEHPTYTMDNVTHWMPVNILKV